ncbi:MAG: efflux transporter outer membrane subunit [Caulobacteraceae bacterium]
MSRKFAALVRPVAVAASLVLSGCVGLPPNAPRPELTDASTRASPVSFSAPPRDWPADDWWRAYGDPRLDALVAEALAGSPDVASAAARLDKARAVAGQARAALIPSLTANGSVAEYRQSYNLGIPPMFVPHGYNDIGQVTLNFNYELDFWGKNRAALAAATSEARASEADAAEARLMLSSSVAAAYADLVRLFDERAVALRAAVARQETLDLVTRRVANGADTRGELEAAAAGPAAARADLAETDEQIALTRHRIAALLGQGPDRGLTIGAPAMASPPAFGLPDTLAADLIGRRPDLVAARWRAEAASRRIGQAKAQFYPDINLAAYIGFQALGLGRLFDAGSQIGQVGPAVSLPIFDGGRLRANLRGVRADYAVAIASYDKTLAEALQQVADAAASERALASRLRESLAALAADEEAYRIARLRYDGGLSDYQSVLLAEDTVLTARRTVVDLRARAFTLDIQLVQALGGGYRQDAGKTTLER